MLLANKALDRNKDAAEGLTGGVALVEPPADSFAVLRHLTTAWVMADACP